MPVVALQASYSVEKELIVSPDQFIERYLYGVPLFQNSNYGDIYSIIENYLLSSQKEFEELLSLKLIRQVIEESIDFVRSEWLTWSYIKASYLVS